MSGETWQMPNTWQQPGFFGSGGTGGFASMGPNAVGAPGAMTVPQMGAGIGSFGMPTTNGTPGVNMGPSTALDWNVGTGQLALGGLSALGNLWTGWNASALANKQFDFTKKNTETNLRNQTQSYNTALDDRARVRGVVEGQSQQQVDDYKNQNRLRV